MESELVDLVEGALLDLFLHGLFIFYKENSSSQIIKSASAIF